MCWDILGVVDFCLRHWKLLLALALLQITCTAIRANQGHSASDAVTVSAPAPSSTPSNSTKQEGVQR